MKLLSSIFIIILLNSCATTQSKDSLDLTTTEATTFNKGIAVSWKNIDEVPAKWIEVKNDSLGYLIYEPCDGSTPSMKFDDQLLSFNSIEAVTYNLKTGAEISADGNSLKFGIYQNVPEDGFDVIIKIFEAKEGIALIEFKEMYMLMTPIENVNAFRRIKNNCKYNKTKEVQFAPYK